MKYVKLLLLLLVISCTTTKSDTEQHSIRYQVSNNVGSNFDYFIHFPDGQMLRTELVKSLDTTLYYEEINYSSIIIDTRNDDYYWLTIYIDDVVVRDTAVWLHMLGEDFELIYWD